MSEQQGKENPAERDYPEDEMTVADSIGYDTEGEGVEVGHGGLPVFWIISMILIVIWAMLAWKPWRGY